MADSHGLVKLGDALRWFRLDWFFGVNDGRPTMQCQGIFIDQDELRVSLECFMDLKTGEVWVQLPLVTVDEIVCQAGEQAKRAELDRRLSSTQRIAPPAGAKETAGAAKRRARPRKPPCADHRYPLKQQFSDDQVKCAECGWWNHPEDVVDSVLTEIAAGSKADGDLPY